VKPASRTPRPVFGAAPKRDRAVPIENPEQQVSHEVAAESSTEELLEFLEADQTPSSADPAFREALREDLWRMLQRVRRARGD
jgi:hypothetical protein